MSWVKRRVAHCDVCGFEWLPTVETPERCASQKCRKRNWNFSETPMLPEPPMAEVEKVRKKLPLKRAPKGDKVLEEALRRESETLSDEDIDEMAPQPISPHNCPKKALHPKKISCSICGFHA